MLSQNYNEYVKNNFNVVKLIRAADKDRDGIMEPAEMRELLSVSYLPSKTGVPP